MPLTLFTTAELASYMQEATIDSTAAQLCHDIAVGKISEYAPRALGLTQSRTVILPVVKESVRLPYRPVTSVTSVAWVLTDGTTTTPITGYYFDGIDEISNLGGLYRHEAGFPDFDRVNEPGTVEVVYVGGVAAPSEAVKGIGLALAARTMSSPPNGLKSETIGSYSYQAQAVDGGAELTDSEMRSLRKYRRSGNSSRLR